MAGANGNSSIFHEIKGDNVQIVEDTAKWNPVANGAFAFSKKPLRVGVSVLLEIEGSGRVSLGIIQIDPLTLKDKPLCKLNDISEYIQINEVRVHRRKCSIKYTRESGVGRVVAFYNNEKFTQNIRPGSDAWLAVYVKFGEVTLRLNSEAETVDSPILSEVIGSNLEFCANGKNEVRTVSANPAAICFIGQPLNINQKISFNCEPMRNGQGETPSRFFLKFFITDKNPKQLQQQHKNLFSVSATSKTVPQWVCSIVLDRDNCNGQITIERATGQVIVTNGMNGIFREKIYADQKSELWVMLDLYRVLVRQVEYCVVTMDTVDGAGGVYITAVSPIREPPQRSMSVLPYGYVTGNDSVARYDYVTGNESASGNDSVSEDEDPNQEEYAISDPPKIDPLKPAEDLVRFEASFNGQFANLVSDLSGLELCDYLISLQVITIADLEKINSKETTRNQNRELLCLLSRRPVPRSKFIDALRDSGNRHLIEKFFPDF
ncbi:hypothetical protein ACJMK2_024560 [Sinanodonta woodiana]|uniref:CARD domain-containing protein n=1 Tax=Sinanodonta woodiana TaxID=1069815 RepID=A0ABD3XDR4_SINWO